MAVVYPILCSEIVITTGVNDGLRISNQGGAEVATATLAAGTYYIYGNGAEANDLGTAIATACDAVSAYTHTCLYTGHITPAGVTGSFDISTTSTDFEIVGTHVATTLDLTLLGHVDGADTGAADPLLSTLSPSRTWVPTQPMTLVDSERVEGESVQHRTSGGQRHTFTMDDPVEYFALEFDHETADRVRKKDSSADEARTFQAWWENAKKGGSIRLYKMAANNGVDINTLSSGELVDTYVLSDPIGTWQPQRKSDIPTWAWQIELAEHFA